MRQIWFARGPLPPAPIAGSAVACCCAPDGTGGVAVRDDPDHPANKGRLCSKGAALGETVGLDGRILTPLVQGQPATWDRALDLVATKFTAAIAEHGPDSVAFYVSGQMLTEDYYIANKLIKGFIGSANIGTNSRLCMALTVAGHRSTFGTDTVKLADVILPATTWGEKDRTVTNSDRTVSRQRPVLPAPGQSRHDWDILADVGRRMGWARTFDYTSPARIFREHAALSGVAGTLGAILRVLITDRVQLGQVFAPIHWTDELAPSGRIGALIAGQTDPASGQPELKATVANVAPYASAWYGFAISTNAPNPATPYAARARAAAGWRMELAGTKSPADWETYARHLFDLPDA